MTSGNETIGTNLYSGDAPRNVVGAGAPLCSASRAGCRARLIVRAGLDIATAPALQAESTGALAGDSGGLLIDMGDVMFIDCAGPRVLAVAITRYSGRVSVRPSPACARWFALAAAAGQFSMLPALCGTPRQSRLRHRGTRGASNPAHACPGSKDVAPVTTPRIVTGV
jgi:anti-anti-sigma regulatory factor